MPEGRILHGASGGVQVLVYSGDIRYPSSLALDSCLQRLLQLSGLEGFVVDLTEVHSIDSTHLGILARLARAMQRMGLPRVTLISDRPAINEVLAGVGLDRVFRIVPGWQEGTDGDVLREIPGMPMDRESLRQLLLASHRELMALGEDNHEQFRDVVRAFEQEEAEGRKAG
ncbi:MAG TPA: anti-sigma factor antagonist [Sedimenticola thiotaurini]|uniref:Anti-sigma factor antagonist n=1 Tax=Sedimenticola thiotaurini TaxID=1543721 RepID=A0A831RLN7_9GAMM|nr:anti-sigma factor antagonist [Sedimenticola thiotaurini]